MKAFIKESSPGIKRGNTPSNNNYTLQNENNYVNEETFNDLKDKKKAEMYNNMSESEEEINPSAKNKSKINNKNITPHTQEQPEVESSIINLFNISEPNQADNLFDIIYKLKHNTDLNVLIKTINKILVSEHKKPFDKSDLNIMLSAKELDKFSNSKKMNPNFAVSICYSLFE
jgi:hypothetical protein